MSCPALAVPNIGMWNTLIVDFAAMSLFHISTSSVGSRMKEGHYECWPALEDFVDTLPFLVRDHVLLGRDVLPARLDVFPHLLFQLRECLDTWRSPEKRNGSRELVSGCHPRQYVFLIRLFRHDLPRRSAEASEQHLQFGDGLPFVEVVVVEAVDAVVEVSDEVRDANHFLPIDCCVVLVDGAGLVERWFEDSLIILLVESVVKSREELIVVPICPEEIAR